MAPDKYTASSINIAYLKTQLIATDLMLCVGTGTYMYKENQTSSHNGIL